MFFERRLPAYPITAIPPMEMLNPIGKTRPLPEVHIIIAGINVPKAAQVHNAID